MNCPKCGSAPISSDYPKAFECGTLSDRRGIFHHTTTCQYRCEIRKPLDARIKRLEGAIEAADRYIEALQIPNDQVGYTEWVCVVADARNAYLTAKYEAKEAKP